MRLHVIRIMFESELSEIHLNNLSYESMQKYLSQTRLFCEDGTWSLSFREYVKLWQLLTWCLNSTTEINCPYQEPSILLLVEPKRAAIVLLYPEEQKSICANISSQTSTLPQKFIARLQGERFDRLKRSISFVSIHPELLISMVEPLGKFSSSELSVILRDQLVRASRWRKRIQIDDRKCKWLIIDRKSSQLETDYSLPSGKLAVGNVEMWCHHVYRWEAVQTLERYGPDVFRTRPLLWKWYFLSAVLLLLECGA